MILDERDASVEAKIEQLLKKVRRAFPRLALEPTFAWAGTFAETEDGLPFFGPHPSFGPRVHFAMGYGGNGITYSIGAKIVCAAIAGAAHELTELFSFDRARLRMDGSVPRSLADKLRARVPELLRVASPFGR